MVYGTRKFNAAEPTQFRVLIPISFRSCKRYTRFTEWYVYESLLKNVLTCFTFAHVISHRGEADVVEVLHGRFSSLPESLLEDFPDLTRQGAQRIITGLVGCHRIRVVELHIQVLCQTLQPDQRSFRKASLTYMKFRNKFLHIHLEPEQNIYQLPNITSSTSLPGTRAQHLSVTRHYLKHITT